MSNPDPSPETRFKPGQSGNPGGMVKGTRTSLTAKLRDALEALVGDGKTRADALVEALLAIALEGDRQAIKDIFERIDGKVSDLNRGDAKPASEVWTEGKDVADQTSEGDDE